MGGIVVIGEPALVAGFALGGATVITAEDPLGARRAWAAVPAGTALVVLTPAAAASLGAETAAGDVLVAVMP